MEVDGTALARCSLGHHDPTPVRPVTYLQPSVSPKRKEFSHSSCSGSGSRVLNSVSGIGRMDSAQFIDARDRPPPEAEHWQKPGEKRELSPFCRTL
eukprot:4312800-Amphidinium_carterae.3